MPRHHAPYAPEFRQQIVELVRVGRSRLELGVGGGNDARSPGPTQIALVYFIDFTCATS
jgi:hypothetical protein